MEENNQKFAYTIKDKTIILTPCPQEDAIIGLGYTLKFIPTEQAFGMIVGNLEEE